MAGFDFHVSYTAEHRKLVVALLRRLQRAASNLDVTVRFKCQWAEGHYATVDGSLPAMQAVIQAAVLDLYPFAEGFQVPGALRTRRRVAQRVVDAYCKGLSEIGTMVEHVAHTVGGTGYSYFFDVGSGTHLVGHATEVSQCLILYQNGLLAPSQVVEELHTFAEALLRWATGSRSRSFESLVRQAEQSGQLGTDHCQSLLDLKQRRKDAKHRSQRVTRAKADDLIPTVVSALHRLSDS